MSHQVSDLVLLVGSNPYPNYLTALALQPDRVHLVYTKETKEVMYHLQMALEAHKFVVIGNESYYIPDAGSATDIRNVIRKLSRVLRDDSLVSMSCLSYNGGTKPMAVHAHAVWGEEFGPSACAVYLDERLAQLRFDNSSTKELDLDIDLQTVTSLHGRKAEKYKPINPSGPKVQSAFTIAQATFSRVRDKGKMGSWQPEDGTLPHLEELMTKNHWLEVFAAANCIHAGAPAERVYVNVERQRPCTGEDELELDVVAMIGHRLHVLSCTTASSLSAVKEKLFEVAHRARQLGGDLARYGVVCLTDEGNVQKLKEDVKMLWDAPNAPRVFGLGDLEHWLGSDYAEPNRESLREWLELGR